MPPNEAPEGSWFDGGAELGDEITLDESDILRLAVEKIES
jgi:hypothetical protein